jgi:hypothetical protein
MSMIMIFFSEDLLSLDDSYIDDLLQHDDTEHMILSIAAKELEYRDNMNKRRGSMAGHVYILRNHIHGHAALMQDYFAEVPTYPPNLFRGRY